MQISLKAARVNRNLKQTELAEIMGVSAPQISMWEKGVNDMSATQFCKFCDVLGVSRDDIFLPSHLGETKM